MKERAAFANSKIGMQVVGNQIDREYLEEISGGDPSFEHDLVKTFIDAAPALLAAFASAVESKDADLAKLAAHTLKGSSRSIGAIQFAEVCEGAEKSARAGDLHTCRGFEPKIAIAYEALKADAVWFLEDAA